MNEALTRIEQLSSDCAHYRASIDKLFAASDTKEAWQECLWSILVCTSKLYLDYVALVEQLPSLATVSSRRKARDAAGADMSRLKELRRRLSEKLESSSCWQRLFRPSNPFSELTGLTKVEDYWYRLALHLPEIYEESFRAAELAEMTLESRDNRTISRLVVALQHLARNHISFLQQALEWAADEVSWEEEESSIANDRAAAKS